MGRVVTILKQNISDKETNIPVETTIGFPSKGLLLIDNEIISYISKGKEAFTVSERGYEESIASSHFEGSYVYLFDDNIYKNEEREAVKLYGKDLAIDYETGDIVTSSGDLVLAEGADSLKNMLIIGVESRIGESITSNIGIDLDEENASSLIEEFLLSINDIESFELISSEIKDDKMILVYNIKLKGYESTTNVPFVVRK